MTPFRCFTVRVFVVAFLLISLSAILRAQSNDARITGIVTDPSKAIIRGAKVDLVNVDTGVRYPTVTNGAGIYAVSGQVGNYRIEVEHIGFKTVIAPGIVLHTQDVLEINFELAVGSASESVTVNAGVTNDNPAVSLTVTREFIENMPLNGRSFQDLIQLAPGTTAAAHGTGYYSINGQRTDANNYTVDGVSANLGGVNNAGGTGAGQNLNGSAPSQTILGTTQSIASIDSLQEFTIQTSGYSAEYGRSPGGQVQFTTRSGTNDIHGTLFEYLRNTAFDANSYENGFFGDPKTAEHQNDFGGTIGGPVIVPRVYNGKGKTFYFFSYEGLRLLLPAFESEYVPTQALRSWSSPNVQPFLDAAPLPSPNSPVNQDGCTITDPTTGQSAACDAHFAYGYSYPNNLDNISARVDQNLGMRFHTFVRYADTPSSERTGAEQITTATINTQIVTAGLTANIRRNLLDDLRFNYSHDGEAQVFSLRPIGGSVPWARNLLIPAQYEGPYATALAYVNVPSTSLNRSYRYQGGGTDQTQYQVIDSIAWTRGLHNLKFGADWRRLTPSYSAYPYDSSVGVTSLTDIQRGYASSLYVNAAAPGQPIFDNLSLYAQDHWRISSQLSVDYGLRWEFNPPPGPSNGKYAVVLTSDNLETAQLTSGSTQPYRTNYHSFAPRLGFAWIPVLSQAHPLTIRGGFGIFFDTGQSTIGNAYAGGYPFAANGPTLRELPLPLSDAALAPPSLDVPLTTPYPYLQEITSVDLTLPYTEQWNLSIDESLNQKDTLTVSYLGSNGRKLLFTGEFHSVPGNPNFTSLNFTDNGSQSSYNALQVQDIGRIANGLDLVASFTWAHALDNASSEFSTYAPLYGNSNNDIRRMLNLALNYQTPSAGDNRWIGAFTHGWLLANRFSAQSGYPLNIVQATITLPDGFQSQYAPDLIPHVPIYLHGQAAVTSTGTPATGGWMLNRKALACTTPPYSTTGACTGTPTRNGDLGRNYLRNPSFWALNTAVQRSFPLYERFRLNFRAEAFNIFNHPNLGNPDNGLSDSTFGQLVYGNTTTIGSSNALYAMGAARSLQFSLHLQF